MQSKNSLPLLMALLLILASCGSGKQISYFQDLQAGVAEQVTSPLPIKLRPEDKISIVVSSKDPQLASTFNLLVAESRFGSSSASSSGSSSSSRMMGYTVDDRGDIDFPIIGKIHVEGMGRQEIAGYIQKELTERNLLKDPIVTVEYLNLCVSVLGEVGRPGRFSIDRDNLTLLDVLSLAGDLTLYGDRQVIVLREVGDKRVPYSVDLCSAQQVYGSPAYYVQQNDQIYVEPNSVRARQSTVNGNSVRTPSFWMSLASFVTSMTFFFVRR